MLAGVVKPVAPPRRKRKEVQNVDPAPDAAGNRDGDSSNSPTKQPCSTGCGSPELKVVDSSSTARYVTTTKPKPARPEPPKFRGDSSKTQRHRRIAPSPSAPLGSKVVSPSSTSDSPTAKRVSFSTPSSPASFEKQSHQNVSLTLLYGKNGHCPPQSRRRQSAHLKKEEEAENSSMTIINSRQHQESGSYLNVAPPPPVKSDSEGQPGARLRIVQKHSERLRESTKSRKEVERADAKKSSKRNGGSIKPKGLASSVSQVLVPQSQTLRKNFTMQPLPPSSNSHGKRLVPVRPAPPAPTKRKATSGNRNCSSVGGEDDVKYEYVDPSRVRCPGAMRSTAEVRLSRELDGLDLSIYSVIDDPPVGDFGKSTSENVYEAINPRTVTEDVYTVPEPLSTVRKHAVTDLSSCASENTRETHKQSNFGSQREKQVFAGGVGYANVQGKNAGYANLQSHSAKSKSFTLDTLMGGPGSPSPTSPCPLTQGEEGGGNSSEEENVYTPMSQATLDSTPVYEVIKYGRNNSL